MPNYRKMDDFKCGIGFGTFIMVKMSFSNKDLLLLLGIVIAVIVTLTTIVYSNGTELKNETSQNSLKSNATVPAPTELVKKAIDKIDLNLRVRK